MSTTGPGGGSCPMEAAGTCLGIADGTADAQITVPRVWIKAVTSTGALSDMRVVRIAD